VTRDGRHIEVMANLGRAADAADAAAAGADGVGLLRSEFLFLGRDELPDEDEQAQAYREIAAALGGRPLTIRTLDVGADKPLPALPQPPEANPFLGRRGLRLGLAEPEILRVQVRAILRVAAEHPVRIMFPMVSVLAELRAARALVERERAALGGPDELEVGIMVEVPSAAVCADVLAREADFFSIGTNDLTQYVMAAERGNEHVATLAAGLTPAVLRMVRLTVAGAREHGRWVGVCGELAGDPPSAALLVGAGVTELSMAPALVPGVKQAVRALDGGRAEAAAAEAAGLEDAAAVRAHGQALLQDA
ncbi:MAG TPA: putative PEP-binding protein, partial [Solirubrobacteraceae bacterium]|nr:putative PEP-binding protein [Solirubrobacteraceae bacterium]